MNNKKNIKDIIEYINEQIDELKTKPQTFLVQGMVMSYIELLVFITGENE